MDIWVLSCLIAKLMIEIYELYKHNITIICPDKNIINIIALNNIINNKDGHLSIPKTMFYIFCN